MTNEVTGQSYFSLPSKFPRVSASPFGALQLFLTPSHRSHWAVPVSSAAPAACLVPGAASESPGWVGHSGSWPPVEWRPPGSCSCGSSGRPGLVLPTGCGPWRSEPGSYLKWSGEKRHQTVLVIIAFFTTMRSRGWGWGEMPISLKHIFDEAVKINLSNFSPWSHFLIFSVMKWDICMKHLSCIPKYDDYLKKKHMGDWVVSWINHCFMKTSFLHRRMNDRKAMVIQTWVFGRLFLKSEQSGPVMSKKTTDSIYCQW